MSALPEVRLKIERRSTHPWIFQKMVQQPSTRLPPGTVVDITDRDGKWVGRGFYNGHSRITLRVLTTVRDEAIDEAFFARKLAQCVDMRRNWLQLDAVTDAYRVVHSEGDNLSGLVVDRFANVVVMEFFAAGMWRFREAIQSALSTHYPEAKFYWFAEEHVQKQESFDCRPPEAPPSEVITENGVKFRVSPGSKHKTGFFVDQRDNRQYLGSFCHGRRVLDLCCNTGGFGVYAKVRGADEVTGVDLDEQALALARQNAGLNSVRLRQVQSDLFPWLRDMIAQKERWDVVVLDPSKQTRDRDEVDMALRKYTDMNRLALMAVADGGLLLTCSCTGLIGEADFVDSLRRAAWQANKQVQILRISGAGGDHPFYTHALEGRYLKAIFARVYPGGMNDMRPPQGDE